ncbi:transcription factor Adf-1-like [Cydia fagiglandana]|uniref:transcription factor Adf-1-like n=1 Tax=Cydia fagiglandana TaxID=1458189 RepID=UPI002FEDFE1D
MGSFTDAEEEKLIKMVISHDILYNASHTNYKSNLIKDNVWKQIGKELNRNGGDCKKKWKCIRDTYHRYKKKIRATGAVPKQTKDRRHILLSFLDSFPPQPRSGGGSYGGGTQELLEEENHWQEAEIQNSTELSNDSDAQMLMPDIIIKEEYNEPGVHMFGISESNGDATFKKKTLKRTNSDDPLQERDKEPSTLFKNNRKKGDDIDLFCRHLEEVLRNLPPIEKAKAKLEMNNILSKYEILVATKFERLSHSSVLNFSTDLETSATSLHDMQNNDQTD